MTVQEEEREAHRKLRNLDRARRAKAAKRTEADRNRKRRLAVVEARMDAIAAEMRETDPKQRWPLRHELRDLGAERMRLKWPD